MNCRQQAIYGEDRIPEEELPARAGVKVVRRNDPDYGLSEDETADRREFIRCHVARAHEVLMMLPADAEENDCFVFDFHATDDAYSAFNTADFQRTQKPFDNYGYAMKKIMERVKDLAILHSVISREEGRNNALGRFNALVELEFRERLLRCVELYKAAGTYDQRASLKRKIGEANRRILECQRIWEQYAPRNTEAVSC